MNRLLMERSPSCTLKSDPSAPEVDSDHLVSFLSMQRLQRVKFYDKYEREV